MTELAWSHIYDEACNVFGNTTAGPQLETDLIEHFHRHPAAVAAAITKLAGRYAAGKVHTPWPLVLKELERTDQRETITASVDQERDRAIHLAEIYITNSALNCPDQQDLLDTIFGPHGNLKAWATDQDLRDHIVKHWEHQQPRAQQAHTDFLQRARVIREARAASDDQPTTTPHLSDDIDWTTP